MAIAADLDLAAIIPAGATLAWGEGAAEPRTLQVSPPGPDGRCSLGVTASYLVPLLDRAPVAIAEVNSQMPATHGDTTLRLDRFSHVVEASYPLPAIVRGPASADDDQLAGHVARLVPDGAVLQVGVGNVLSAVTRGPAGKRDLAIHSGLLSDDLVALVEAGVVTNAAKERDRGVSVATEYGAGELRTGTLMQRAQRLAAIAHPKFRAELLQALPS